MGPSPNSSPSPAAAPAPDAEADSPPAGCAASSFVAAALEEAELVKKDVQEDVCRPLW